ncbi:MAG TPA: hypothetical protein PKX93_01220 [bacterium]|nr:hypothetical protein [bacterium]
MKYNKTMVKETVEKIKEAEAKAEEILASAKEQAARLLASVSQQVDSLRMEKEKELNQLLGAWRKEQEAWLQKETAIQQEQVHQKLSRIRESFEEKKHSLVAEAWKIIHGWLEKEGG